MSLSSELLIAVASYVWEADAPCSPVVHAILPALHRVRTQSLAEWLDGVAKPAFIGISAEPGVLIVLGCDQLPDDARGRVTREIDNQGNYFRQKYDSMPERLRTGSVRVSLPTMSGSLTVDDMRRFFSEYSLLAPWTLVPVEGDDPHIALDVRRVRPGGFDWSASGSFRLN